MTPAATLAEPQSSTASHAGVRFPRTTAAAAPEAPCEFVWTCMRGRTRLCCQLDVHDDGQHRLTLLRNSRTYGEYAFSGREAALTFATRLRDTFAGNGWAAA